MLVFCCTIVCNTDTTSLGALGKGGKAFHKLLGPCSPGSRGKEIRRVSLFLTPMSQAHVRTHTRAVVSNGIIKVSQF